MDSPLGIKAEVEMLRRYALDIVILLLLSGLAYLGYYAHDEAKRISAVYKEVCVDSGGTAVWDGEKWTCIPPR